MLAILVALLQSPSTSLAATLPPCIPTQLRLSTNGLDGASNGMSHGGIQLSLRNAGRDCALAALPTVQFRDGRGRLLPAMRRAPVGMHPGPAMAPVRLASGHRVATDLRWVSGPVFPRNRSVRSTTVAVSIGATVLRAPLRAVLYGEAGKPVGFEQLPLRAVEGMAAG